MAAAALEETILHAQIPDPTPFFPRSAGVAFDPNADTASRDANVVENEVACSGEVESPSLASG